MQEEKGSGRRVLAHFDCLMAPLAARWMPELPYHFTNMIPGKHSPDDEFERSVFRPARLPAYQRRIIIGGMISATLVFAAGLGIVALRAKHGRSWVTEEAIRRPLDLPVREEPAKFPSRTHLPSLREGLASGSIELSTFSPGRDLVYINDTRVWWESDNDAEDTEDDHTIHKSLEAPLRRLIELVCQNGGTLKVQDAYRPNGVHNRQSLHKEGRAVDVTCDEIPLEKLAKLCWAAGFDWVYYETRGGAHVHCSVKRTR